MNKTIFDHCNDIIARVVIGSCRRASRYRSSVGTADILGRIAKLELKTEQTRIQKIPLVAGTDTRVVLLHLYTLYRSLFSIFVAVLVPLGDNTDSSYRQPLHQVHLRFAAQQLIRYTTCILVLLPGPYLHMLRVCHFTNVGFRKPAFSIPFWGWNFRVGFATQLNKLPIDPGL